MRLHFDRADVLKILEHSESQKRFRSLYGKHVGCGMWLVGDEGIYLMSNAVKSLQGIKTKNFVAYARECNPDRLSFDEWWENKNQSFGTDDGGEFLPAADICKALGQSGDLEIDISPTTSFKLMVNP